MALVTRPLEGPFGVEVTGVDIRLMFGEHDMRELVDLFYAHQFLVVRDQQPDLGQFTRYCEWFGRPKPHFLDHLRLPGAPAVLTLSNVFKDGKPTGVFEGASFWHTDVAYETPPNSATIAYSITSPAGGVALQVANMVMAYDALDVAMKREIDDLVALHHYGNRDDMDENSPYSAEKLTDAQKARVANVWQPLVMRHPVTGRKSLYAVAGSSFGIQGWPDDEALDLLDRLKVHATAERFVLRHTYLVGDVAAWDTFATLHKAPLTRPATGEADARLLWRISVTGHHAMYDRAA